MTSRITIIALNAGPNSVKYSTCSRVPNQSGSQLY
jgi:hypothetical protein